MTAKTSRFEIASTCWKCDGTGYIAHYAGIANGVCFKCVGAGYKLTKRGQAARTMYAASLTVPASELAVGDTIRWDGISGHTASKWVEITEIRASTAKSASKNFKTGEYEPFDYTGYYDIIAGNTCHSGVAPSTMMRVAHSADAKRAKMEAALDYQNTLTKAGTPRKRKAVA